jgi:hypothetical protein
MDQYAKGSNRMVKRRPQSRSDVPWAKRREIPDQQIIDAANQYQDACELLSKEPPGSGLLLPLVNAAAVSIELYLKSLSAERIYTADVDMPDISIVSSRAERAIHTLRELFDKIPNQTRAQLIGAYDDRVRPQLKDDVTTALEGVSGAFLASRYPFETGANITKYSVLHLITLARFLRAFTNSMPVQELIEWKSETIS